MYGYRNFEMKRPGVMWTTMLTSVTSPFADRMDPFVSCYIVPSSKHRTRNHKDGGSEPQWNETLYL
jgi:hypothetical protein